MKRLIISGFSALLVITAAAPAFARSSHSPLLDSNPPAEVPSPSLFSLDPTSAVQPGVQTSTLKSSMTTHSNERKTQRKSINPLIDPNPPAEVPSPTLFYLDPTSAVQPGMHI